MLYMDTLFFIKSFLAIILYSLRLRLSKTNYLLGKNYLQLIKNQRYILIYFIRFCIK